MIGIIIALPSEADALLKRVENLEKIELADKPAYLGLLNQKETVIAISGIGKVSAALTTQLVIDKFAPDFIINFGTCGGINDSVKALEYYAIEKCCQFDFDLRDLDGVPLGYIQEYDTVFFKTCLDGLNFMKKSVLASADRFTCNINDVNTVNEIGASLCDMEGGAIAQVCTSNNVPLVMIKGISDVHGSKTAQEQFFANLKEVAAGFPDVILKVINEVCKAKNS